MKFSKLNSENKFDTFHILFPVFHQYNNKGRITEKEKQVIFSFIPHTSKMGTSIRIYLSFI